MHTLPRCQTRVCQRIPISGELIGLEQAHFSAPRFENVSIGQSADARVPGTRQHVSDAKLCLGKAMLLKPSEREAAKKLVSPRACARAITPPRPIKRGDSI